MNVLIQLPQCTLAAFNKLTFAIPTIKFHILKPKTIIAIHLNNYSKFRYFASYAESETFLCMPNGVRLKNTLVNLTILCGSPDSQQQFSEPYLLLRSPNDLTLKDAREMACMKYDEDELFDTEQEIIECGFKMARMFEYDPLAANYLRFKGYAVPFLNFSVQKLLEAGWIKFQTPKVSYVSSVHFPKTPLN